MKRLVFVLFVFPILASAENWRYAGEFDFGPHLFVDVDSISKATATSMLVNVKVDNIPAFDLQNPLWLLQKAPYDPQRYAVYKYQVDCQKHTSQVVSALGYDVKQQGIDLMLNISHELIQNDKNDAFEAIEDIACDGDSHPSANTGPVGDWIALLTDEAGIHYYLNRDSLNTRRYPQIAFQTKHDHLPLSLPDGVFPSNEPGVYELARERLNCATKTVETIEFIEHSYDKETRVIPVDKFKQVPDGVSPYQKIMQMFCTQ